MESQKSPKEIRLSFCFPSIKHRRLIGLVVPSQDFRRGWKVPPWFGRSYFLYDACADVFHPYPLCLILRGGYKLIIEITHLRHRLQIFWDDKICKQLQ